MYMTIARARMSSLTCVVQVSNAMTNQHRHDLKTISPQDFLLFFSGERFSVISTIVSTCRNDVHVARERRIQQDMIMNSLLMHSKNDSFASQSFFSFCRFLHPFSEDRHLRWRVWFIWSLLFLVVTRYNKECCKMHHFWWKEQIASKCNAVSHDNSSI